MNPVSAFFLDNSGPEPKTPSPGLSAEGQSEEAARFCECLETVKEEDFPNPEAANQKSNPVEEERGEREGNSSGPEVCPGVPCDEVEEETEAAAEKSVLEVKILPGGKLLIGEEGKGIGEEQKISEKVSAEVTKAANGKAFPIKAQEVPGQKVGHIKVAEGETIAALGDPAEGSAKGESKGLAGDRERIAERVREAVSKGRAVEVSKAPEKAAEAPAHRQEALAKIAERLTGGEEGKISGEILLKERTVSVRELKGEKNSEEILSKIRRSRAGTPQKYRWRGAEEIFPDESHKILTSGTSFAYSQIMQDLLSGQKEAIAELEPLLEEEFQKLEQISHFSQSKIRPQNFQTTGQSVEITPRAALKEVPHIISKIIDSKGLVLPKRVEIPLQTPAGARISLYLQESSGHIRAQLSTNDRGAMEWLQKEVNFLRNLPFETEVKWTPPQYEHPQQQREEARGQQRHKSPEESAEEAEAFEEALEFSNAAEEVVK